MEWVAISIVVGIGIVLYATVQIVKMGIAHEDKRLALKAGVGDAGRTSRSSPRTRPRWPNCASACRCLNGWRQTMTASWLATSNGSAPPTR